MYILFGNEIVDSEEIRSIIENESPFRVDKDLSRRYYSISNKHRCRRTK